MIGSIVPNDDGVLAPVLVLAIEHLHQMRKEDLHGLGVVVRLQKADEDFTETIDSRNQRYSWANDELLLSWGSSSWLPASSMISDRI